MFWGLLLEEGKFYSQTVTKSFHVSMAALEPSGKGGSPVTVNLEQDGMDFILCTLKEEALYQQPLDLNFAENDVIKFFLSGKGTVHLTGFVVSDEDSDDELDEESEEEPPQLTEAVTKPKETEKVSDKKPVKEAKEESEESEDESDEDSDEDSDDEVTAAPKTKKPAVPDKKVQPEKKPEKPVAAKKEKVEEDSDEDDSDEDDSDDDAVIDFKKLMQAASDSDDDDDEDDEDIDMEEMDDEEEEESDDDSSEEESPPKKAKKTPPVTPNTEGSKVKKEKKTPVSSLKEAKKEKAKPTPEPVVSGKKRKEIDSPLVNGVGETSSKKSKKKQDKEKSEESPQVKTPKRSIKGGIVVEDLKVGNGPESTNGKYVNVYYSGKLKSNNQQFDSNLSGKGFKFRLGGSEVIKGWDLGVVGMKVGGKRRLTIPYKMAYGEKGSAPEIPPKADLVFDVELRNVN